VTEHDVLVGFRLRLVTLADELGNVSAACRAMGVHRLSYYRLKRKVDRWAWKRSTSGSGGAPGCRTKSARIWSSGSWPSRWPTRPRAQAHVRGTVQGQVGRHPDLRTRRLARAEAGGTQHPLQAPGAGGPPPRPLRAQTTATAARAPHRGLSARREGAARLLLCRPPVGHQGHRLAVHRDRRRLRLCLGRARTSQRNPRARHTRELPHRVAKELRAAGWRLREVTTDNGSEFRSRAFAEAVEQLGARQRFIKAGRPNSNGCAERLQLTILEECWRPAFARSLVPKTTALQRDLDEYLQTYNTDRAHTGRLTQGRVPADIVHRAHKTRPVR
jgi:transposase InsO family protein